VIPTTKLTPELARQLLIGGDLDREEIAKLRGRIEDLLRKNPAVLYRIAGELAADGQIRIDDLI